MLHILVIEDDAGARIAYERLFRHEGYHMIWSSTALGAIELLRTEPVDLVILDYELDGTMTGLEVSKFVRRLNARDGHKREIILISGHPYEEIVGRAKEEMVNALEGISFYFGKPLFEELPLLMRTIAAIAKEKG